MGVVIHTIINDNHVLHKHYVNHPREEPQGYIKSVKGWTKEYSMGINTIRYSYYSDANVTSLARNANVTKD